MQILDLFDEQDACPGLHRYEPATLWGNDGDDDLWDCNASSVILRSVCFHPLDHVVAFAAKRRVVVFKHGGRAKEDGDNDGNST